MNRKPSRQTYATLRLRSQTHEILKGLSDQLDKSLVALLHEAALILQAKHGTADEDPAESPKATTAA